MRKLNVGLYLSHYTESTFKLSLFGSRYITQITLRASFTYFYWLRRAILIQKIAAKVEPLERLLHSPVQSLYSLGEKRALCCFVSHFPPGGWSTSGRHILLCSPASAKDGHEEEPTFLHVKLPWVSPKCWRAAWSPTLHIVNPWIMLKYYLDFWYAY